MATVLKHNNANVHVEKLPTGKNKIYVELTNKNLFMPIKACETSYPIELIDQVLHLKGPDYLCDEILRDESPTHVQKALKYDLLGYLDEKEFKNKRLLDFGCGSGASTMILARMFPHTEIVGIELEEKLLSIAHLRATHYEYKNVKLMNSPNPNSLPQSIGCFDYVVLSAVYEHLLPSERKTVLAQIWSILNPKGILFLNQTPYRYFPVETHTTSGLVLINYLPDIVAFFYAQHFSKRKLKNEDWNGLLRKGIRGGSVKEILNNLTSLCPHMPVLLNPTGFGMKDRIDLWNIQADKSNYVVCKRLFLLSVKLLKWLTGVTIVPSLSLAIKKGD